VILAGASLACLRWKRCAAGRSIRPGNMNRTEAHPVELAIVAALVVADALLTLVVAALVPLVALVLTLVVSPRTGPIGPELPEIPTPPPAAPEAPLARPQPHPLATLAAEMQLLPVTQLRAMTGTRSKSIRKAQLIAMVAACS
jgi:hypothetical protein